MQSQVCQKGKWIQVIKLGPIFQLGRKCWAKPKGGAKQRGGGGAKPRKDGPSETIFGDPPKTVFEGVTWGKFWEFVRDFIREMALGGGGGRTEVRGGRKLFSVGVLLVRFCPPPPPLFCPPPWRSLEMGLTKQSEPARGGRVAWRIFFVVFGSFSQNERFWLKWAASIRHLLWKTSET